MSTGPSQRRSQSSAFASIPKNSREAKNPLQPPAVFPISPAGLSQSPTPPRCSGAGQRDVDSQGWRLGSTFAVFHFLLKIPRGSPHGAAPASCARFSTWLGAYEDFKKPGPRHVPKRALIRGRHEDWIPSANRHQLPATCPPARIRGSLMMLSVSGSSPPGRTE